MTVNLVPNHTIFSMLSNIMGQIQMSFSIMLNISLLMHSLLKHYTIILVMVLLLESPNQLIIQMMVVGTLKLVVEAGQIA